MEEKEIPSGQLKIPKTLSESIYQYLRESIMENTFKPAQKINEKEIAKIFGVSRTPVREALAQLAAEGLVAIDHHRGVEVKEVSFKEVREVFQVLKNLDFLAMSLIMENIKTKEINKLENLNARMEESYHQNETEKFSRINLEFHERIWILVTNNFLKEILWSCLDRIRRYTHIMNHIFQKKENMKRSLNIHRDILEALKKKDAQKLKILVSEHWSSPLP